MKYIKKTLRTIANSTVAALVLTSPFAFIAAVTAWDLHAVWSPWTRFTFALFFVIWWILVEGSRDD